MVGATET